MSLLLTIGFCAPLAMLFAMPFVGGRRIANLIWAAPLPGLLLALFGRGIEPLVLDPDGLRLTVALDLPSALLMGTAALLWSVAGRYARSYLGDTPRFVRFAAWWLLTLSGSMGVFVAGDLISFYLTFAIVSLAAFGLVIHDDTPAARRAGALYLLLAVLGEIALLLAFALLTLSVPNESLAIADVVPLLAESRGSGITALLLMLGFGLKMGLLPLHVWLPVAHPAAPMPASAVLSGAVIKAGVVGMIRFFPAEGAPIGLGETLAVLGFLTAYWGVAMGLTQHNPKTVLAYSSVSQMGVVAAVVGMGMALGAPGWDLHAAFYASHHVMAKGALFLAVGVAVTAGPTARLWVLPLALFLALGFGGLPPTGGAMAKLAVKGELGEGLAATCAALSALGSTMLMLHFVHRLSVVAAEAKPAPVAPGLLWPWLGLGGAAVLLPWLLFAPVTGKDFSDVWSASAILPVLAGAVLAFAWWRWARDVPQVPEGDILVLTKRGAAPREALTRRLLRVEALFRPWPAAGLALMGVALALLAAMALV